MCVAVVSLSLIRFLLLFVFFLFFSHPNYYHWNLVLQCEPPCECGKQLLNPLLFKHLQKQQLCFWNSTTHIADMLVRNCLLSYLPKQTGAFWMSLKWFSAKICFLFWVIKNGWKQGIISRCFIMVWEAFSSKRLFKKKIHSLIFCLCFYLAMSFSIYKKKYYWIVCIFLLILLMCVYVCALLSTHTHAAAGDPLFCTCRKRHIYNYL